MGSKLMRETRGHHAQAHASSSIPSSGSRRSPTLRMAAAARRRLIVIFRSSWILSWYRYPTLPPSPSCAHPVSQEH
jgi:hypothetical protein